MKNIAALLLLFSPCFAQIDEIRKKAQRSESQSKTEGYSSYDNSNQDQACFNACEVCFTPLLFETCGSLFSAIGQYHTSIVEKNPHASGFQVLGYLGQADKFAARSLNAQFRGIYVFFGAGIRYWYFTDNYGAQSTSNSKANIQALDFEILHLNLISTKNLLLKQINSFSLLNITDSKGNTESVSFYDFGVMMGLNDNRRRFCLEMEYHHSITDQYVENPRSEFLARLLLHPKQMKHLDLGFHLEFRNQAYFNVTEYNFIGAGLSFWIH